MPSWRPILDGPLAARARATVESIAAALADRVPESAGEAVSLSGGGPGHALLMSAVGRDDDAGRFLDLAVDALAREPAPVSLHGGLAGVAWVAEHLGDEPGDAVEDALAAALASFTGHHDLLGGLAGLAVYALEQPRRRRALLERILDLLEESAAGRGSWEARDGRHHVGVAHGAAGVICVLAPMAAAGLGRARALLDKTVAWLLARRSVAPRLAWCTGDPGVAAALLAAARCAGEETWEREALAIARRAAAEPAASDDVSLCHGAAGLGHVFNRIHQTTGDAACGDAARRWLARALELGAPRQPGMLVGATGVALALTAAVSNVEPGWDRLLGISIARPAFEED